MVEIWKKTAFLNYEVSSFGRVRNIKKGTIRKKRLNKTGYFTVRIVGKWVSVHRLVAVAFIPNTELKPEVNHINGIRDDNRIENLEWCTRKENQMHAIKTGLQPSQGWREKAAPIIAEILKQNSGIPEKEIKRALVHAYPFGAKRCHPYKIWLDEIKAQKGVKTKYYVPDYC